MKRRDKLLIGAAAVLAIVVAAMLIVMALGWIEAGTLVRIALYCSANPWWTLLGAGLLLAAAYRMLLLTLDYQEERAIMRETALGEVRIALHAVEQLVQRTVKQIRGVREVSAQAVSTATGMEINVILTALPDNSLPELAYEVQQQVEEYMRVTTGLTVNNVKVRIKAVAGDVRPRVE